ncbi:MAG: hypothetical protein M3552_06260 [Planctomycetota bacterium]|nr:hypothetical protein [Planctomycetota bacterium]
MAAAPVSELPTPAESARRVVDAAKAEKAPLPEELSVKLAASDDPRDVWLAVAAHTLIEVEINPEMRVKVAAGPAKPTLTAGRTMPFFVRVENRCGATARLAVTATDLASNNAETPDWLDVEIVNAKGHSDRLSGAPIDYKLLMCRIAEPGRREVRLGFDAGQGTQDLGFRGVTDILFHVRKEDAAPSGD